MKKLVLLFALCVVVLFGCGGEEKSPPQQSVETMSVGQKFVIVGAGHYVSSEDASVPRAKELIGRAAKTYGISEDLVADQAYTTYKIGKDDGIQVTAMEVLEAATLSYVADSGMKFAEACSMYLTLRKSGMAHAESMMGIKGLVSRVMDMGDAARR